MEVDADVRAYDALSQHPRINDLAAIARALMTLAAETRRAEPQREQVARLAGELNVARDEAGTPFGNALDILERGPEDDAERALVRALAAHAVALSSPKSRADEDRTASELLWLATHTQFDATSLLDRALGDAATKLWEAIADRIRRMDQGTLPSLGRGELLVACVALASSQAKRATQQATALAGEVGDGRLAQLLSARSGGDAVGTAVGEMSTSPRGPVATTLLALTGILLVMQASRLLARVALAYRKPAEVSLSNDGGVRVRWRIQMLGRTLRDRDVLIPRAALMRATREVRYPGLALYAGLVALALGSCVGISAFVEGGRVASPSMLGWGLAIVALGLAIDFALSSITPGAKGRCRVLFVARDGVTVCVSGVDARRADMILERLARP